jgi:hypothetical protein
VQHSYLAAKPVYDLLGAGARLSVTWRPGGHETRAGDLHTYLDWFETVTGQRTKPFPVALLHARYEEWQQAGEQIDARHYPARGLEDLLNLPSGGKIAARQAWQDRSVTLPRQVLWGLVEEPAAAVNPGASYGAEPPYRQVLLKRFLNPPPGLARQGINFGDYIAGDLYYPERVRETGQKVPAVVWLNPHSCARGYVPSSLGNGLPHLGPAREGLAVFAFDAIGTGYRIEEETRFYWRYPRWSLLGTMVRDARAAVDALERAIGVDRRRIYLAGYGLGGRVALYAAALDGWVAGVVSVAGFTPMRLDTPAKGTGGVARLSHWHVLQPRLGAFLGQEARLPFDFHEVLALIAPRPLVVVAPRRDRHHTLDDIQACVGEVRKVYALLEAAENLSLEMPDDFNRCSPGIQKAVGAALRSMAAKAGP